MQDQNVSSRGAVGSWLLIVYVIMALLVIMSALSKAAVSGNWQGILSMGEDFLVVLDFQNEGDTGRIRTYQGDAVIQDDPLTQISVKENMVSFFIADKHTRFKGVLQENQIIGKLYFPDGMAHPITFHPIEQPYVADDPPTPNGHIYSPEKQFAVGNLEEDLDVLQNSIIRMHPNPFLFVLQEQFAAKSIAVQTSLQPLNELEFYRLLAPIVASVGCCHTSIRPSSACEQWLQSHSCFFPFDIGFVGETAVLTQAIETPLRIEAGTRLCSINGKSIQNIINTLSKSISSDGYNPTARLWEIQHHFVWLYALYLETPQKFTIEFESADSKINTVAVPAARFSESHGISPNEHPQPQLPHVSYDDSLSMAVLTVENFAYPDFQTYHNVLQTTFAGLKEKNINFLVIDVRGNKGGHPLFAAELYSFLTLTPFQYFSSSGGVPEFDLLTQQLPPKPEAFQGKIFFMVDGGCLSTTGHFLALAQYHNLGKFIGQTPGSTFYCHDNSTLVTLPHTGIRLNVPRTTFEAAVQNYSKTDRLQVDYLRISSVEDFVQGSDVDLDMVKTLLVK